MKECNTVVTFELELFKYLSSALVICPFKFHLNAICNVYFQICKKSLYFCISLICILYFCICCIYVFILEPVIMFTDIICKLGLTI